MNDAQSAMPPAPENHCPQCGAPLKTGALAGLCPACLLKQGAAMDTVTGAVAPFTPPTVEELAAKFPQLEILSLIGKGGMGAVYKARQKQLDRFVALKILPPGIGNDPSFAGRFAREARALARLNHPNIVTIHDFGQADGLFYLLMEYVDGMTLRQLLNTGRVSPREALAIVPQICDALQFAHDSGIVHRDIKPENILLDRLGRVKVADFGLAKLVGAEHEPATAGEPETAEGGGVTEAGKIIGTPQYMAPEQREHPGEVDHRADIYALGVVFYQMLTGELPGRLIEPPSKKVHIDVRLDEVVLRALEKEPELRYQQASMLKTQVETIAQTPPPVQQAITPAAETEFNPWQPVLALIGVLFGVCGFIVAGDLPRPLSTVWFVACPVVFIIALVKLMGLWPLGPTPFFPKSNWAGRNLPRNRPAAQSAAAAGGGSAETEVNPWQPVLALIGTLFGVTGLVVAGDLSPPFSTVIFVASSFVLIVALLKLTGFWPFGPSPLFPKSNWTGRNLRRNRNGPSAPIRNPSQQSSLEFWMAINRGNYAQAWEVTAPMFQRSNSKEVWVAEMEKVRRPLGKALSCKTRSSKFAPDRSLIDVVYETSFDSLRTAVESATSALQPNGEYKIISYHIKLLENEPSGAPASPVSHFSRTAIVGACLIPLFAIPLLFFSFPMLAYRQAESKPSKPPEMENVQSQPAASPGAPATTNNAHVAEPEPLASRRPATDAPNPAEFQNDIPVVSPFSSVVGIFVLLILGALGLAGMSSPFLTTILGWIAIAQVRHSNGKLYGLGLAVFDALFYPLLALDALIFMAFSAVIYLMRHLPYSPSLEVALTLTVVGLGLLTIGLVAWLDFFIVRRVWRAVNKPPHGSPVSTSPSGQPQTRAGNIPKLVLSLILVPLVLFLVLVLLWIASNSAGVHSAQSGVSQIESVVVSADKAVIKQRNFHGEGMDITFGNGPNSWTPGSLYLDAIFDVTQESGWFHHGVNWVIKSRHGMDWSYRLDGPPGPMLGKIAFHPGTPVPEADGSYVIAEFRADNGQPIPIAVKLTPATSPAPASNSWTASLPQGTLSLVAVSEYPWDGAPWWSPDGSPYAGVPFKDPRAFVDYSNHPPGQIIRQFIFRADGVPPGSSDLIGAYDPSGWSSSSGEMQTPGTPPGAYYITSAALPDSAHTVNIKARIATGEWNTVAEFKPVNVQAVISEVDGIRWNATFTKAVEQPGQSVLVTVGWGPSDPKTLASLDIGVEDTRFVAVDEQGVEHTEDGIEGATINNTEQLSVTFKKLPLKRIKAFRLEARPYSKVEFDNVVLNPAAPATAALQAADNAAFGPVIELDLPFEGQTMIQEFLSFESGKIVTPPALMNPHDDAASQQWITQNSIDAFAEETSVTRLISYEFKCVYKEVDSDRWQTIRPEEVAAELQNGPTEEVAETRSPQAFPATFLFKTREGNMGIVQMLAITDNPRGVKLRYKLVRNSATAAPAVTITINADGSYLIGKEKFDLAGIKARLKEIAAEDPRPTLVIEGGADISYEMVTTLVGVIGELGLTKAVSTLPAASPSPAPPPQNAGQVVVNVKANGDLALDGKAITPEKLQARLTELARLDPDQAVILRGDEKMDYKSIAQVLDICQSAKIWNIAFSTATADGPGAQLPGAVAMFGSVTTPGLVEIPAGQKLTLSSAIAKAGGVTWAGDLRKVKLTRKNSKGSPTVRIINVKAIISQGADDVDLQDGDIIMVPQQLLNFGGDH